MRSKIPNTETNASLRLSHFSFVPKGLYHCVLILLFTNVQVADGSWLDIFHSEVSEQLISTSNNIDDFFINERRDDEGSRSKFILGYQTVLDKGGFSQSEHIMRARLHLPKTQNRLRLVIEGSVDVAEDETARIDDSSSVVKQVPSLTGNYQTALQFILTESELWQVSTRAGLRLAIPLNPTLRLRLRRSFFVQKWTARLVQRFFWENIDGFSESTSFDIERPLLETLFFRVNTQVIRDELVEGFQFSHQYILVQNISKTRAAAYTAGTTALLKPAVDLKNYFINMRYRHSFFRKWLFYEVIPEINFVEENQYNAALGIRLKIDMVFGKYEQ